MSHEADRYARAYLPDIGFPVRVFMASSTQPGFFLRAHWHEQIELLAFRSGAARLEIGSHCLVVRPGDLVVINSNEMHAAGCLEAPLRYDVVIFDQSLLLGAPAGNCEQKYLIPLFDNRIVFSNRISPPAAIRACLDEIIAEARHQSEGYELLIKSAVFRLLGLLFRDHVERILTVRERRRIDRDSNRLKVALRHIERHYDQPLNVAILARIAGISAGYFAHLFKRLTGQSVNDHLTRFRIKQAERLLRESSATITEIALATGFSDASYFSRIFRRINGCSPSRYRRDA